MATGADIPPELFKRILRDVCEDAERLLDLDKPVPSRKEAIKNVTACSLTCVYWAHICRRALFWAVWIKNYEDMCAFAVLVANTPAKFTPISKHVGYATIVQRVEDRPWLHLVRMQPSLFRFLRFNIIFHIEDAPKDTSTSSQRSMSRRLFACLSRTPPSSCLQCTTLTIDKPHFVTPHDLTAFLQNFNQPSSLVLTNVTWDAQIHLESHLLTGGPLDIFAPGYNVSVLAHSSEHILETAWLAFATTLHGHSTGQGSPTSGNNGNKHQLTLQVLPSAQRPILEICNSLCEGHKAPRLEFYHYTGATSFISLKSSLSCE